jgi:hypothetical protein
MPLKNRNLSCVYKTPKHKHEEEKQNSLDSQSSSKDEDEFYDAL